MPISRCDLRVSVGGGVVVVAVVVVGLGLIGGS